MVPELPAFDAKAFTSRLHERVLKPDGSRYSVFDPAGANSLVPFVQGLRTQQDNVERHDVQLGDQKTDIDEHSARLLSLESKVAALEAQPATRFP